MSTLKVNHIIPFSTNEITMVSASLTGSITNADSASYALTASFIPGATSASYVALSNVDGLTEFSASIAASITSVENNLPPFVLSVSPETLAFTGSQSFIVSGSNFDSGVIAYAIDNTGTQRNPTTSARTSSEKIVLVYSGSDKLTIDNDPYDIVVENENQLTSTLSSAFNVNASPIWQTPQGKLGNITAGQSITASFFVSASDPEGGNISYTISSGSLPSGLTLISGSGEITGSSPIPIESELQNESGVNFHFTITANDSFYNLPRNFYITKQWINDGSSEALAAPSVQYLIDNGITQNGTYWIDIDTIGATQLYCDLQNQKGALLFRGYGPESYAYGNAVWTNSTGYSESDLLTGNTGNFAKSAAFYYMTDCNTITLNAGGFSGNGADGTYRDFTFSFTGTNTPVNLMFTTTNAMSWNSSYSTWRSTFGQDRTTSPMFERNGSSSNQSVGANRSRVGCGKAMMFGFQSYDGAGNDVNSGLGTNNSYCGGDPGGISRGSWSGNNGYIRIYAK